MTATIRKIEARDEARWRELWDGYCRFYERAPAPKVNDYTWRRIMDAASPVHGIVAERAGEGVIGIANYIIHENTSALFVDPQLRAAGVGRQLIDWLVAEMKAQGWSRLYWNTRENNYRARGLYDKYTPHSGFLRYVVNNPAV